MNIINGLLKLLASASYATIYIFANELFPTNVRNTGMGTCSMIARIGAMIGTYCNDSLVNFVFMPIKTCDDIQVFIYFILFKNKGSHLRTFSVPCLRRSVVIRRFHCASAA